MSGKLGNNCDRWPNSVPTFAASARRSLPGLNPHTVMLPDVGWRIPASILIVVLFPRPVRPNERDTLTAFNAKTHVVDRNNLLLFRP